MAGEDLHRARLKSGMKRNLCQFKGFNVQFDAAFFIGYHSKAGTLVEFSAIRGFQRSRMCVSAACQSASTDSTAFWRAVWAYRWSCSPAMTRSWDSRPLLGNIEYVAVKKSLGYFRGEHLPMAESRARIREAAKRAVQQAARMRPAVLKVQLPVVVEVDLCRYDNSLVTEMDRENLRFLDNDQTEGLSDVELVGQHEPVQLSGPETISFACGRYVDAYNTLSAIMSRFYERDIEWLIEEVAKPEEYRRDLEHFLGGHPLQYVK